MNFRNIDKMKILSQKHTKLRQMIKFTCVSRKQFA